MEKRDEYVEKMKAQLDQWNGEIAKWEAKADVAQAEARIEFDKRLEAVVSSASRPCTRCA